MKFRLGLDGLPPREVAFVNALLRLLAAEDEALGWEPVGAPPFDALVVGAQGSKLHPGGRPMLVLGGTGNTGHATVENAQRPLRADVFRIWLARTRKHLSAASSAAAAPARVRLKRWPPAEMIRSDQVRIRMATLLSRRALSPEELAALAQCSPQRCEQFLHVLHGFALLEAVGETARPAPPAERPASPKWGLVKSIRRRLGLAATA